jgi:glycosyltransferase involved in cell wall biosynthesis
MVHSEKPMRVLWFANTPGLSQQHLNNKVSGGGWISSLQAAVENSPDIELGFVFYHEEKSAPFIAGKTTYFPVRKLGFSKKTRLLNRITSKAEYEENLPYFLQIIRDFKPDVIHVHGTEFSFGLIVKHIQDIPIVISIQGNLTVYEKKYFSGMTMPALLRQLKAGYPFFSADYSIWQKRSRIELEIMKKTKYVFGRTDWDRRISLVQAPAARYFHIDEVMRPDFYQVSWAPPSNQTPIFFTTCSASLYKGFETIIDTAALLTANGFSFTWHVAGLKEGDALVKLVKQWKDIDNLKDINIRLLGTMSSSQLIEQLLQANIYVQVSHIENSPNSLCVAMLAGIPIIASFAGGTGSLMQDKVHGVLVQNGDAYALAGGLVEMTASPAGFIQMGVEARRVAHQRHNPHAVTNQLETAYSMIIRDHHSSATNRTLPNHSTVKG